jgi:hypothetical protein
MQLVMSTRESDAERSKVKLAKGENSQSRLLEAHLVLTQGLHFFSHPSS